jgi:hypothetical protein
MHTQLTLEEKYCDAIFNQGKDFSKILALMLDGKNLELSEPMMDAAGAGVDVDQSQMDCGEHVDIFTILSIYQKAVFAGIKQTHTDRMLLHFLANQPISEIPQIKYFTSALCGARFFTPVLDSAFFHLDLSLLEPENIFPAISAFIAYMYQKPHAGFNLNIVINEPNEMKVAQLGRVLDFVRPFVSKHEFHESIHEKCYTMRFCMSGNLIPSLGSAFKPVPSKNSIKFQRKEPIEQGCAVEGPPFKKPKPTEVDVDFDTEVKPPVCAPM